MKAQARLLSTLAVLALSLLSTPARAAEPTALESISVQSRLDPNAILITEIDVVFIYDAALLPQIPATKSAWYGNKRHFTRSAGAGLDVVNLFIPQGFDSDTLTLPARKAEALEVLVFAYHDSADAAPADITTLTTVQIEIDPFGIRVK